jgi:Tfp pilus assembly ATPase PilU
MMNRVHGLLALLPEEERQALLSQVLSNLTATIAKECEIEDEKTVRMIAEIVRDCLEE